MKKQIEFNLTSILILFFFLALFSTTFAKSGFNFFDEPIDLSHGITDEWTDIDVSAYIPEGATGVMLDLVNSGGSYYRHAVRKKGSSDERQEYLSLASGLHTYAFSGVDDDRIFQSYIRSTGCKIYLLGYTDDKVGFLTNAIDISIPATRFWEEIDLKEYIPPDATGVIVEAYFGDAGDYVGLRRKGSFVDRTEQGHKLYWRNSYLHYLCGVDENLLIEGKIRTSYVTFHLIGYVKNPINIFDDPINIDIGTFGAWTDIDLTGIIPNAADGAIMEISNLYWGNIAGTFRKNGSSFDESANSGVYRGGFVQGACGLDTNNLLEGFVGEDNSEVSLLGFSEPLPEDIISPDAVQNLIAVPSEKAGEVDLIWSASGDDSSSGIFTGEVRIQYSQTSDITWNKDDAQVSEIVVNVIPESQQTYTVTGLNQGANYYFRLWTSDEMPNWSGLSNEASAVAESDAIAPNAVSIFSAVPGVMGGEINLSWISSGDDAETGTLKSGEYRIQYSTSSSTTWDKELAQIVIPISEVSPESWQYYTVKGLVQGEMYYFRLWTSDEVYNWSEISSEASSQAKQMQLGNSGFNFLLEPIDVSIESTGTWIDVDVSSHIPEGATGVILELYVGRTQGKPIHTVRKKGSTDGSVYSDIENLRFIPDAHRYIYVGVDENRIFQNYISDLACKIYLLGYTDNNVGFFLEKIPLTMGAIDSWIDIDARALGVPDYATGVIVEMKSDGGKLGVGIRKKGSIDDRTEHEAVYSGHQYAHALSGLNENGIFQAKIKGDNVKLYLLGYTRAPITFFTNPIKLDVGALKAWFDINLAEFTSSQANGAIIDINNIMNETSINPKGTIRKKGSAFENIAGSNLRYSWGFTHGASAIDPSQVLQGWTDSIYVEFHLLGYTEPSGPDVYPPYTSNHSPEKWATDVSIDTDIELDIKDFGEGVDESSIVMTVDGAVVSSEITPIASGYHLEYFPESGFEYEQILSVTIDAQDLADPPNAMSQEIYSFVIEEEPAFDTRPPLRWDGMPTGVLAAGTLETELAITTNEKAFCRYADFEGADYYLMENTFLTIDGKDHFAKITALQDGASYFYYVKCEDELGNVNDDDYIISFEVAEESCADADGDGYLDILCGGSDCDDTNEFINPSAEEICEDGIDQDCDGEDEVCEQVDDGEEDDSNDDSDENDDGEDEIDDNTGTKITESNIDSGGCGVVEKENSKGGFCLVLFLFVGCCIFVRRKKYGGKGGNNMKKQTFLITLFSLIFSFNAIADDQLADDCSADAIQTAITNCIESGGGTVTIPACIDGDNGSLWEDNDCVCFHVEEPTELRILGAGQHETILKYADEANPSSSGCPCSGIYSRGGAMFQVMGSGFKELGHLTLSGSDTNDGGTPLYVGGSACSGSGVMNNARFHHVSLKKFTGSAAYICEDLDSVLLFDNMYVGDMVEESDAYGFRIHGTNDTSSWEVPAQFGSNTGVFIEDSTFNGTYHPVAGHGSAKYTVRYNEFYNYSSALEGHGPSYSFGCMAGICSEPWQCYQGVQRVEVYGNEFHGDPETTSNYATYVRSGSWAIWGNKYIDQLAYKGSIVILLQGVSQGPHCLESEGCPYEITEVDLTKSCSSAGIDGCWQSPRDIYIWDNEFINPTAPGCSDTSVINCIEFKDGGTGCLRENHEIFLHKPQSGDPRITSYNSYPYPHPLVDCVDDDADGYCDGHDCNDDDPAINPEAVEICDDELDNDCDGLIDFDDEEDCFITECEDEDARSCDTGLPGVCAVGIQICIEEIWGICEQDIFASDEICDDELDNDCDGLVDFKDEEDCFLPECPDGDQDGYLDILCGGHDCDDRDEYIFPDAEEICDDGIDQDCDGADLECEEVDADGDGFLISEGDCDDSDKSINPSAEEICDDEIDNDCDGYVDTNDASCNNLEIDIEESEAVAQSRNPVMLSNGCGIIEKENSEGMFSFVLILVLVGGMFLRRKKVY